MNLIRYRLGTLIKNNFKKLCLMSLTVMLGIGVMYAFTGSYRSIKASFDYFLDEYHQPDGYINAADGDPELAKK